MLTAEQNERIARVGPGTPGGNLLRRYWHPVAAASELTVDRPKKRVRILGEDLVLYRIPPSPTLPLRGGGSPGDPSPIPNPRPLTVTGCWPSIARTGGRPSITDSSRASAYAAPTMAGCTIPPVAVSSSPSSRRNR